MTRNDIVVRLGGIAVGREGEVLAALGLGSCIAIALYDPVAKVGGLAHVVLPSAALSRRSDRPGMAPETALPRLIEDMVKLGAERKRVSARLAGGASMFASLLAPGTIQMGERNVVATRYALAGAGIPLIAEAVGGTIGRTIRFDIASGEITVRTITQGIGYL